MRKNRMYARKNNKQSMVSFQNIPVHNRPFEQTTFITDLFITDHVHSHRRMVRGGGEGGSPPV